MVTLGSVVLLGAEKGDAAALAKKVQGFYERTRDFQASFVQTYNYAAMGRAQVSKGTIKIKKPGKLRWDYLSPVPKTIAVSGNLLVQYEPEANQAYVDEKFDASAMGAAVTFLWGKGNLAGEFQLSVAGDKLVLTPKKSDPRVASIELTVKEDGEVTTSRVIDGSGNVNEIAFTGASRNVGLKDTEFEVKLPADVHRMKVPGR
jgi:outer membrane lipoprotein carrier protein